MMPLCFLLDKYHKYYYNITKAIHMGYKTCCSEADNFPTLQRRA